MNELNKILDVSNQELDQLDTNFINQYNFFHDISYFHGPAGKEHYRLLMYVSEIFNKEILFDVGTNRCMSAAAMSAAAMSASMKNNVISYDLVKIIPMNPFLPRVQYFLGDVALNKKLKNSSFIFFADVDGTQDYCYLDDFFFADISLLNNETIVEETPFEIDYSNLSNVILLFILLFAYLGVMALGFTFKNGGFVSFGFFIGIVLGFMLSGFNVFLTLVFIFMNIVVIWNFIKR